MSVPIDLRKQRFQYKFYTNLDLFFFTAFWFYFSSPRVWSSAKIGVRATDICGIVKKPPEQLPAPTADHIA
jgi:hypothetical protein